jgi:hypothetical protein
LKLREFGVARPNPVSDSGVLSVVSKGEIIVPVIVPCVDDPFAGDLSMTTTSHSVASIASR